MHPALELLTDVISFADEKSSEYNQSVMTNKIIETIDLGLAVNNMCLVGNVVTIRDGTAYSSCVPNLTFDENKLAVYVAAYNKYNIDTVSVDELKESFFENGEIYISYDNWLSADTNQGKIVTYSDNVKAILKEKFGTPITEANSEQIEEAIRTANGM